MSELDDLHYYVKGWDRHARWMTTNGAKYTDLGPDAAQELTVKISDVPEELRHAVFARMEEMVATLVMAEHLRILNDKRSSAVAEAKYQIAILEPLLDKAQQLAPPAVTDEGARETYAAALAEIDSAAIAVTGAK